MVCSSYSSNTILFNINDLWEQTWHGTKYQYLESIVENGLKPSGSTVNGKMITPHSNHYGMNQTIDGVKEWAKAIFVSPSLFYSADVCYAERIISENKNWAVLVQCLTKRGSFKKYKSTIFRDHPISGETTDVEYRVQAPEDKELIYRVIGIKSVYVTNVVFVNVGFLDNVSDFVEGNIIVDSKEERELLNQ